MRRLDAEEIYSQVERPVIEPIKRHDGKGLQSNAPLKVVWPVNLKVKTMDITRERHLPIILSDFGESFRPSVTSRNHARTRLTLIPPGSFFVDEGNSTIFFPSETWTLGCTLIEIMGSGASFDTWADMDAIISEQVMTLGKLPDLWWNKWDARTRYDNIYPSTLL